MSSSAARSEPGFPVSNEVTVWHNRRRLGGARRESTARVSLARGEFEAEGWTLNVSRGGLRVVLEEPVAVGQVYRVRLGSFERGARVIWVQTEDDGQIAGLQYLDISRAPADTSASCDDESTWDEG